MALPIELLKIGKVLGSSRGSLVANKLPQPDYREGHSSNICVGPGLVGLIELDA